jgi:TetR/AcrR family transcriptional regulator, cholesterol catabolism regulator
MVGRRKECRDMTVELTRRERKKEETRDRIFQAAMGLFKERGFEATTIEDIAERADVAKGTFFNYYPRKEAVLAYFIERRFLDIEESMPRLLAEKRPARETLVELFIYAGSAYGEDRELSRHVFVELMKRQFEPVMEAAMRLDAQLAELVASGQRNGEMRGDIAPLETVHLLADVYITTVHAWLFCLEEKGDFDLSQGIRRRLDLVFDGLAMKGGRS